MPEEKLSEHKRNKKKDYKWQQVTHHMLKTKFCNVELNNPTILASGILGTSVDLMKRVAYAGAGAITPKSIGFAPKRGHKNPAVVKVSEDTIINAVGLPTPGYEDMIEELRRYNEIPVPIIGSVYASTSEEYAKVAKFIEPYVRIIELNISCPHRSDGILIGADAKKTAEVVCAVKNVVSKPVMPKLTPNCKNIIEIAMSAQEAGADAICAINTFGPKPIGIPELGASIPGFGKGGISGPCILEETLDIISDIYDVVDIPIVGTGGISTGQDALRMIKAGARAVGVGSAVAYRGIDVFSKICNELSQMLEKESVSSITDLVGVNSK